jgi:hypothetical protein
MNPNRPIQRGFKHPLSAGVISRRNDGNKEAVLADGLRESRIRQALGDAAGATLRLALAATSFRLRYARRRLRLMTLLYCLPIRVFTSLRCFDSVCVTMVIRSTRFNIYLLCLVFLAPFLGCRSPESRREKQLATFRVHLEVNPDGSDRNQPVPIYRAHPAQVNVERDPFLTEGDIAQARVTLDTVNGFSLQIQFEPRGTLLLEQYSAMNSGKRFAIFSEFGERLENCRWLGAPIIPRRISNGVLAFTPDATRDEAEQIAIGLNNVAIKNGNQAKPKTSEPEAK